MKADDLGPAPDDPGGGQTIRVEVRTSGQLFLLQTLERPETPSIWPRIEKCST